jgi:hypothetical protein
LSRGVVVSCRVVVMFGVIQFVVLLFADWHYETAHCLGAQSPTTWQWLVTCLTEWDGLRSLSCIHRH